MAFLRKILILALCGVCVGSWPAAPDNSTAGRVQAPEYEIKAAYLYYFGVYTRWPASAFQNRSAPFVVGVLGEDPFGDALEKAFGSEKIEGRSVKIVRAPAGGAPPDCQLLFVSNSERRRAGEIIALTRSKPILTVGDFEQFCRQGGGIRFQKEGRNVKLVMNPGALRASGLRVDSELLQMATITETEAKP